jgi:hypothetical protein
VDEEQKHKVLGVQCMDVSLDEFRFDMKEMIVLLEDSVPTKRSVVKITAKFFDPLLSSVTVLFKMLYQQICEVHEGRLG